MKIQKILALAVLAGATSVSFATGSRHCGGYTPPPDGGTDPECVVTWDFTDNTTSLTGDPLTYASTSTTGGEYSLVVHGFGVGRKKSDYSSTTLSYSGKIFDGSSTYAVDPDTSSRYGIGVHANGESEHWGTKIDNQKSDDEQKWMRDAVLLDFGACIVSIDEISLLKAYSGADTDFELWAYTGATELVVDNSVIPQIPDYDSWTADGDWSKVIASDGGSSDRVVDINSSIQSRYFVLIAGYDNTNNNDAFRLAGLTVTCDPEHCEDGGTPPGGGGGEAPVPGTLALLGIGALAARRRWRKPN